ncbi:MAG: ABC transporter permease, partial [Parachlamydiaceae bacterium]|nr:ABC transporter permease [Parachlamydiaceae bacterium]
FMGIGQVLTIPLFFASNALYPIEMMPKWLQILSIINPLSYQVNALRNFMVTDAVSTSGLWVDFGVGIFAFFVLSLIAARAYPKILY